jgi:hypothetical protein
VEGGGWGGGEWGPRGGGQGKRSDGRGVRDGMVRELRPFPRAPPGLGLIPQTEPLKGFHTICKVTQVMNTWDFFPDSPPAPGCRSIPQPEPLKGLYIIPEL